MFVKVSQVLHVHQAVRLQLIRLLLSTILNELVASLSHVCKSVPGFTCPPGSEAAVNTFTSQYNIK